MTRPLPPEFDRAHDPIYARPDRVEADMKRWHTAKSILGELRKTPPSRDDHLEFIGRILAKLERGEIPSTAQVDTLRWIQRTSQRETGNPLVQRAAISSDDARPGKRRQRAKGLTNSPKSDNRAESRDPHNTGPGDGARRDSPAFVYGQFAFNHDGKLISTN